MNVHKHTTVVPMQCVQTLTGPTPALAMMDGQVMDSHVKVGIFKYLRRIKEDKPLKSSFSLHMHLKKP